MSENWPELMQPLLKEVAVYCGAPVGANRCRLAPHNSGRHDVAPDYLLDAYRVQPTALDRRINATLDRAAENALTRIAATPFCPVTERVCSCRPGERCNPAVRRA